MSALQIQPHRIFILQQYMRCFCFIVYEEISNINYFKGKNAKNMLEYVSTNCEQLNAKNIELLAQLIWRRL